MSGFRRRRGADRSSPSSTSPSSAPSAAVSPSSASLSAAVSAPVPPPADRSASAPSGSSRSPGPSRRSSPGASASGSAAPLRSSRSTVPSGSARSSADASSAPAESSAASAPPPVAGCSAGSASRGALSASTSTVASPVDWSSAVVRGSGFPVRPDDCLRWTAAACSRLRSPATRGRRAGTRRLDFGRRGLDTTRTPRGCWSSADGHGTDGAELPGVSFPGQLSRVPVPLDAGLLSFQGHLDLHDGDHLGLARGLVELDEAGVQHLGGGGALRLGGLGGVGPTPVADLVPQRTGRVLLPPVEAAFHVPVVEGVEVDDRGAPGLQRFVAHPGALDPGIVGRKRPGSSEDQARHQAHREQRGGADEAEPAGLGAFAGHAHLFSYRMPGAFWAPRTDVSLPGGSAQCASVFSGTGSVSI